MTDTIVAVVPVRALEGAKSRLGEALDAEERRDLVVGLLRRTLDALRSSRVDRTIVVSADEEVLEIARADGATALRQLGGGLNAALEQARIVAIELGATSLVIVPGDLASITGHAVDAVLAARPADAVSVVLVPDRHGRGTNALLLTPPNAVAFAFGGDSRLAHESLAREAGARYVEALGPLSLDLDTPDDLLLARGATRTSGGTGKDGVSVTPAAARATGLTRGARTRRSSG